MHLLRFFLTRTSVPDLRCAEARRRIPVLTQCPRPLSRPSAGRLAALRRSAHTPNPTSSYPLTKLSRPKLPFTSHSAPRALRTLRRMLHKAEEWKVIGHAPRIKLMKEHGRHLRLDDDAERKLTMGAFACNWRLRTRDLFRDIIILMRDTGMRNERELFRMRVENLDWQNRMIFVPDSKTAEGRRLVPMSGRVFEILRNRCDARQQGWVFPSKRSASGHLRSICNLFRKARNEAGLPKELVLYCARHDYGTRVLMRTGNLAAVMRTMGHRDVKTAMRYQHPELEIVRAALDCRPPISNVAE